MSRDYKLYLDDIIEAIDKILAYTAGMDFSSFDKDDKTADAVLRNLEVIGEASKSLPEEVKELSPEIDWRKITNLRNVLIHEYFGVNRIIVWDIVENKLKPLKSTCIRLRST